MRGRVAEHEIPDGAGQVPPAERHPARLLRRDGDDLRARGAALLGGGGLHERADRGRLDGTLRTHRQGPNSIDIKDLG